MKCPCYSRIAEIAGEFSLLLKDCRDYGCITPITAGLHRKISFHDLVQMSGQKKSVTVGRNGNSEIKS